MPLSTAREPPGLWRHAALPRMCPCSPLGSSYQELEIKRNSFSGVSILWKYKGCLFIRSDFLHIGKNGFQASTSAFVSKLQSSETMYCLPMAVINPRKLQVKKIFRFRLRTSQALHGFVRHIKPSSAIWKAKISFVIVASNATIPRLVSLNVTQFADPVLVDERKTILDGLLNCIFIYPCV